MAVVSFTEDYSNTLGDIYSELSSNIPPVNLAKKFFFELCVGGVIIGGTFV